MSAYTSYSVYNTRSGSDPGAPITRGVAASSTNTYYSDLIVCGREGLSITIETSGTLTGTWTLWKCDRMHPELSDDTGWVDMSTHAEFVETNPAGAATKWSVNAPSLRGRFYRLKYVNASGTGTLTADATPVS